MGAWGEGPFENGSAADWCDDLRGREIASATDQRIARHARYARYAGRKGGQGS